jgi:hypothetical protein
VSDIFKSTGRRFGYLLLRDGHAIPLRGISPEAIKDGAKHRVLHPDVDPLKHRQTLNAIVDRLGFDGDFGTYLHKSWPEFQAFLKKHRCTNQVGIFPMDHGGCIDLCFSKHGGPSPRELADRIFFGPQEQRPRRVFLGYGVDWSAWDNGNGFDVPPTAIESINASPEIAVQLGKELFARRLDLMGQWGFLDDKLVHVPLNSIIDKTYWELRYGPDERAKQYAKTFAAVRAFRAVFDNQPEGWVDILPYNDRLVVLRAHDGGWDLLWHTYRETEPPKPDDVADSYKLAIADLPSRLMSESDLIRAIHFRQEVWDEDEAHKAEQAFYDRGGSMRERQLTTSANVRRTWMIEQGIWPSPSRAKWARPLPSGFYLVEIGGRKLAVSDLIDLSSFRQMLVETGFGERQGERLEPWDRANEGVSDEDPVGASWVDAQAYCAWRERQLGVSLRLLTQRELRAIRPAYSKHYESMSFSDFPWENWPPRPLAEASEQTIRQDVPSAVNWSEPRFLEPGPDVAEFPPSSGVQSVRARFKNDGTRKIWIKDFPPSAAWKDQIPWAEHQGIMFIDAWDAYEWCQEAGFISGRFWEGCIGSGSWGAYKNIKVSFRVVMDIEG